VVELIHQEDVRTAYELGAKVLVAANETYGVVLGIHAVAANPYQGHTPQIRLEKVEILTATTLSTVLADQRYCGVTPRLPAMPLSLIKPRNPPPASKRLLERRKIVELIIGRMKTHGSSARNLQRMNWATRRVR
jgi:hypothetical protein